MVDSMLRTIKMGAGFSEIVATEAQIREVIGHPSHRILNKAVAALDDHCRTFMRALQLITVASVLATGVVAAAAPASAQNPSTSSAFALSSSKGQAYPTKHVRIITGSPSAMPDIVARHLGQRLSERWGQPVVVENRATLLIGTGVAAKSSPDGYTLLLGDRTYHAAAPSLYKSLSYDPVKDFAPITLVALAPQLLVAHPSVPAADLREFIAYAKQYPRALDFASAGPGTAIHMTAELLKHVAGINLVSVHYKGGGAAMIAILSGEAKAAFSLMPIALPHVRAGKVKAYVITSKKRFAGAPDIPTAAEAGLPGFESDFWVGMFAPARTPAALIGKLNRDIVEILQTSAMQDKLLAQGTVAAPGTPDGFAAFIRSETVKLKTLIELTGMRAE